jgi:hypothetical protein
VVLYQGGFSLDRGIEQLFEAIRSIDDATLVLMGYGLQEATYRESCCRGSPPPTSSRCRSSQPRSTIA